MVDNPVINGLLVWSTTGPDVSVDNPIGPRAGGAFEINDPTWGDGQVVFNYYAGSVSNWATTVQPGLALQKTTAGKVALLEPTKIPTDISTLSAADPPLTNTGQFRNTSPLLLNNSGLGINIVLPQAREWVTIMSDVNSGASDDYRVEVVPSGGYSGEAWKMAQASIDYRFYTTQFDGSITSTFDYTHDGNNNTNSFRLNTIGYVDPVLGAR